MALTATAVPRVRDDIVTSLELADPFISSRSSRRQSAARRAPAARQRCIRDGGEKDGGREGEQSRRGKGGEGQAKKERLANTLMMLQTH